MHIAAELVEEIGRPIPAIGCLENHLGLFAGGAHCRREVDRVVVDATHRQHLTRLVLVHDHRTATMQIDLDVLSRHRGLLCRGFACEKPRVSTTRVPTGAEAPLRHRITYRAWCLCRTRSTHATMHNTAIEP